VSDSGDRRANENVVTQAEDAFGKSIGRETIGIYSAGSVRGFSALSAGNARIDTLFFDQIQAPTARLRRSTTIRVGLAALGFPFPAPTGIVDYALRAPGQTQRVSGYVSSDTWGGAALEVDIVQPLGETLSIGAGAGLYKNEFGDGTDNLQHVEAINVRWTPSKKVELQPFWQRSDVYDDDTGPLYITAGPFLPPRLPRRVNSGPKWAKHDGSGLLYGLKGTIGVAPRTLLRAGLFRSVVADTITASNLYTRLQPSGLARHVVTIDPPGQFASTSGELRLTQVLDDGPWTHVLHASARGRSRERTYGGSDQIDLGTSVIGAPASAIKPLFEFSQQSRDRVRQMTAGLAYEGRWKGVGEASLGVQKTTYRKIVSLPAAPVAKTSSSPLLFNATAAAFVTDSVALYAGYVRGLEESGVAPANAANRNQPLPAIGTSQRDAGIRWTINPTLRFVAGIFDVRKPYFQLNESNVFELLGDVRNKGVEMSLAGKVSADFSIVAGAVILRPRVTGEGVRLGRVGSRPVGLPARTLRLNADWRPPFEDRLSIDFGVAHGARRPGTRDNSVYAPGRTIVDFGARYRIREGDRPLTVRLSATNVFNTYAVEVLSSGTYYANAGRLLTLSLAADY
jgi:iron complex outermembrane receptor protein